MRPSPLLNHPVLDEWVGCRVWIKHENYNPTGAFKVRGGLNLVAQLSPEESAERIMRYLEREGYLAGGPPTE